MRKSRTFLTAVALSAAFSKRWCWRDLIREVIAQERSFYP